MSSYFTIDKVYTEELSVKDSQFIALLYPLNSKEEFNEILSLLWKEHPKARHICYAYILDQNNFHYYDDGEPSGTAGMRIYSALKFKNLSRCALFVIRYFGGTKLGVGPLAKAYFEASMKVINSAQIVEKFITREIVLKINYHQFERLKKLIKEFSPVTPETKFAELIELKVFIEPERLDEFLKRVKEFNVDLKFLK